jgi:hypothetical protein
MLYTRGSAAAEIFSCIMNIACGAALLYSNQSPNDFYLIADVSCASEQKTDAKKGELFAFIFYFAAVTSAPLALPIVISTVIQHGD